MSANTTRQMSKTSLIAPVIVILAMVTATWSDAQAAASGVLLGPDALPARARTQLAAAIEKARRDQPRAFSQLAALRAALPQLAASQRGRVVTVYRPLRALGSAGLMPMLAELAFAAAPRGKLEARTWQGWQVSLLEATGSLRDGRAAPVLKAIALKDHSDPVVLRAAVTGFGRLASNDAAVTLIGLLRRSRGSKRLAVLGGVGDCRRASVARELTRMLGAPGQAQQVIAALARVGNAWAWKTPAVSRTGEGERTRRLVSSALIARFTRLDVELQRAATKAILLVAHPSAKRQIAAARRGARGAPARALAQLAGRVAANPLERY